MRLFGLVGATTRTLLTYRGRVIVHEDRAELEALFPGTRVAEVPTTDQIATLPLRDHPDMTAVRFPLTREAFRR